MNMEKSKIKLILGWICIIFGITSALVGTWFYQNAITAAMYQTAVVGTVILGTFILNLQLMAILAMGGVLLTIIGIGLKLSSKIEQ